MTETTNTKEPKPMYFFNSQRPMASCPNCKYQYDYYDPIWGEPYCPRCGQHLSWESDED